MSYWTRRKTWLKARRQKSWDRMWRHSIYQDQMVAISSRYPVCACGHRHWPCGDPGCANMFCGGPCRQKCGCKQYDPPIGDATTGTTEQE